MIDFVKGRSLDYETEWCPAGIFERFEKFKMAAKMPASEGIVLQNRHFLSDFLLQYVE